MRQV
jgi:hypothetical protein